MTKVNEIKKNRFIRLKGSLYDVQKPQVMAIMNLTPDSFYEKSRVNEVKDILKKAEKYLVEGADILDIGAVSTRPNAEVPSEEEELKRLLSGLKEIRNEFPNAILSIDTFRAEVARIAIEEGADLINDVSGCSDKEMPKILARTKTPYILTHSDGNGSSKIVEENNPKIVEDIIRFFSEKLLELNEKGIHDVILDPGFGFDKTLEDNYLILNHFESLKILDRPLLAGISRKSMVYKKLSVSPENSLNGTTGLHSLLIHKGCNFFRVHDVLEMKQIINLFN